MTERTKKKIAELRPQAQKLFTAMCQRLDISLGDDFYTVYEALRTQETQEAYFAQGRETLSEVNARRKIAGLYPLSTEKQNYKITWTLKSKHLEGLAMDILPVDGRGNPTWDLAHYRHQFEAIREAGRNAGLECGADWPHYQVRE
jgi:hypothetical protein